MTAQRRVPRSAIALSERVFRFALLTLVTASLVGSGGLVLSSRAEASPPPDPFTGASPTSPRPPDDSGTVNLGDWGVAEGRGTATYTIPIDVPPARQGMAPDLALRYSSGTPLRGGVAAGWTLDIPSVSRDRAPGLEVLDRPSGLEVKNTESTYAASLRSASGRLVRVSDISGDGTSEYRVEFDDGFARFFKIPATSGSYWQALTTDGSTHYFGGSSGSPGDGNNRWPISSSIDVHGNSIQYFYESRTSGRYSDHLLQRVEYSANEVAGLTANVKVEFDYGVAATCGGSEMPLGAAPLEGDPLQIEGSQPLQAVRTSVRDEPGLPWRLVRKIDLTYELRAAVLNLPILAPEPGHPTSDCIQPRLRYLAQVLSTAYNRDGEAKVAPSVAFTYNDRKQSPLELLDPIGPFGDRPKAVPGFGEYGTRSGTKGSSLDMDADGILDLVSVEEQNKICTLTWIKGKLGGGFEDRKRTSPLPTAAWHRPRLPAERCSFNGQIAFSDKPDLSTASGLTASRGLVSYHFMDYTGDGRIDLLTNVWAEANHDSYVPRNEPYRNTLLSGPEMPRNSYRVQDGDSLWSIAEKTLGDGSRFEELLAANAGILQPDGALQVGWDLVLPSMSPAATGDTPPGTKVGALTPEGSPFLWRVYPSAGDPGAWSASGYPGLAFSSKPMVVIPPAFSADDCSPKPLGPTSATNEVGEAYETSIPSMSIPNLTDIDGDGFLDLVDPGKSAKVLQFGKSWCVFLGRGGSTFGSVPYRWSVPDATILNPESGYNETVEDLNGKRHIQRTTGAALIDMNGDGRADLTLQSAEDRHLKAFLNTGEGFHSVPLDFGIESPLEVTQTDYSYGTEVLDGARGYTQRLVDVDQDGLPDLLRLPAHKHDITNTGPPSVRYNTGDRFLPRVELPGSWTQAQRLFLYQKGNWHLAHDFFDANGDGRRDLAKWSASGQAISITGSPGLPSASDLLHSVDNGRGGSTTFQYSMSTDPSVASWQQDVDSSSHLPTPLPLVRKVVTNGGFETPEIAAQYTYAEPVHLSSASYSTVQEHQYFAGFRRANIEELSSEDNPARLTATTFDYGRAGAPDGRAINTWQYEVKSGQRSPHSYSSTKWEWAPLYDGKTFVANRTSAETHICENGMSEEQCKTAETNATHASETWVEKGREVSGSAALYVRESATEGVGRLLGDRDRKLEQSYKILFGLLPTDNYQVLHSATVNSAAEPGTSGQVFGVRGRVETDYNEKGLPIETRQWADPQSVGVIKRTFDDATGNLLTIKKPSQVAPSGSGLATSYEYDRDASFVASTTNELGHQVMFRRDVATGALLERKGPNFVVKPDGEQVWERETWEVDGFGRSEAHAVSFAAAAAAGYQLITIQKTSYHDSELPNRVRHLQLQEVGIDNWVTQEWTQDGLGRALESRAEFGGKSNVISRYVYDARGNISSVGLPDPRSDEAPLVMFEFKYDGFHRNTQVTRPDGNGVGSTYNGLTKTVIELAPDASAATTEYVYDPFDRLIQVRQHSDSAASQTSYGYDSNDNLTLITNADNATTTLGHDWLNQRLNVTRNNKSWGFVYDLDGNVASRTQPSALGAAANTVQYAYDELGRPESITYRAAESGGTNSDRTESMTFDYDEGPNAIGRLSQVTLDFGVISYEYDARGFLAKESRTATINSGIGLTVSQSVSRSYNAVGQLLESTWEDGQRWRNSYDSRGLIKEIEWFQSAQQSWQTVAAYERAVSGQPRVRNTDFGQTRSSTLDVLGRVETDEIRVDGKSDPVATRSYTYDGTGELRSVTGATGAVNVDSTFSYDPLHRLTKADGPSAYSGTFTYTPAGNLKSASISSNDVKQKRDVRYEYGTADPEAVDRLVDNTTGGEVAHFAYDAAGNTVTRSTEEEITLNWDGLNRLRSVQTPKGNETYYYDHNGNRVLAIKEGAVRFWFGERETHFKDGVAQANYLHIGDGPSALARIENGDSLELQYGDQLQNLILALDGGGNSKASFVYGPYGEVLSAEGSQDHSRQFNGKEHDSLTGLSYYGHRYYDSLSLRWNSADPLYLSTPELGLEEPQRLNVYSFSLNNPVRYIDPDGKDPKQEGDEGTQTCEAGEEAGECTTEDAPATSESDAEAPSEPDATSTSDQPDQEGSASKGGVTVEAGNGSIKGEVGKGTGYDGKGNKKNSKTKVGISVSASVIDIKGKTDEAEIAGPVTGSAELKLTAAKVSVSAGYGDGSLAAGAMLAAVEVEACAEICTPVTDDWEACVDVCGGGGLSVGAAGSIGKKTGLEAGVVIAKVKATLEFKRTDQVLLFGP